MKRKLLEEQQAIRNTSKTAIENTRRDVDEATNAQGTLQALAKLKFSPDYKEIKPLVQGGSAAPSAPYGTPEYFDQDAADMRNVMSREPVMDAVPIPENKMREMDESYNRLESLSKLNFSDIARKNNLDVLSAIGSKEAKDYMDSQRYDNPITRSRFSESTKSLESGNLPEFGRNLSDMGLGEEALALASDLAKTQARGTVGGGQDAWQVRIKEWDDISKITDDAEKKKAIQEYLYRWTPSAGYNSSPDAVNQAGKKAGAATAARITTEASLSDVSAQTEKDAAAGRAAGVIEGQRDAREGFDPEIEDKVSNLRKEFEALPEMKSVQTNAKNLIDISSDWNDYVQGKTNAQAFDQKLGYYYNKTLDATSVVMPGEFDRILKGSGWTDQMVSAVKSGLKGGLRLTDDQRMAYINGMKSAYNALLQVSDDKYQQFKGEAERLKVDPSRVIGGYSQYFESKGKGGAKSSEPRSFATVEEAEAANLPKGTVVLINGRKAVIE
jgi:hypothetical protein